MKVLMVFTSKFHYTGITKVVMNYYEEMKKIDDLKIDFLVPNIIDEKLESKISKDKSKIFVIPMKIRRYLPIKYLFNFCKIVKKEKYDIVHVHGSSSIMSIELLAAKIAGAKTRIAHSHNTVTEHKFLHRLLNPLFNLCYTDAFACGKKAGEWLFKDKEFYIVNNAQKLDEYAFNKEHRIEMRKKYNLNNKIVLGHVGAFNEQKNHEFLIDVFYELNKVSKKYILVLIGEGPLFEKIKQKVDKMQLNDRVIFVGKTLEVGKWLNAMDIMLLPSKYEGLPNVLIEWQMSQLKCIISDNITREVKLNELVFFEPLIVKDWVNKIIEVTNVINENRDNQEKSRNITEAGYDIKIEAIKLYEKYKECLKKGDKNG